MTVPARTVAASIHYALHCSKTVDAAKAALQPGRAFHAPGSAVTTFSANNYFTGHKQPAL